jgi:hypothetical protein
VLFLNHPVLEADSARKRRIRGDEEELRKGKPLQRGTIDLDSRHLALRYPTSSSDVEARMPRIQDIVSGSAHTSCLQSEAIDLLVSR